MAIARKSRQGHGLPGCTSRKIHHLCISCSLDLDPGSSVADQMLSIARHEIESSRNRPIVVLFKFCLNGQELRPLIDPVS